MRYEVWTVADAITAACVVARYPRLEMALAEARSLKATNKEDYRVFETRQVFSTEKTSADRNPPSF